MMHIAHSPYFCKIYKFPPIFIIFVFLLNLRFLAPYFDDDAFVMTLFQSFSLHFFSVYGPPKRISPVSQFPCIFQDQGQKKHSNFHLQSCCDTIHEKVYQVLVHSFVRNQPERRWGQFFPKYFYFPIVMTHL